MTFGGVRLLGAGVLALLCAWAGVRLYVSRTELATELQVPVGRASAPTPSDLLAEENARPIRIPDALPAFSLNDLQGKVTPIASWSGKSLVINFWATWCAPCRREIPLLNTLAGEWAAQDIAVLGVAVDHLDAVARFRDQFKITYPLLIGEQDALDAAASFGVSTPVFPFTVFTDKRGEVVALFVGELHREQADLIVTAVGTLNNGSLNLDEARRLITKGLDGLARKS